MAHRQQLTTKRGSETVLRSRRAIQTPNEVFPAPIRHDHIPRVQANHPDHVLPPTRRCKHPATAAIFFVTAVVYMVSALTSATIEATRWSDDRVPIYIYCEGKARSQGSGAGTPLAPVRLLRAIPFSGRTIRRRYIRHQGPTCP
jgi:hypothetical protein